jgi:hypothetical protein
MKRFWPEEFTSVLEDAEEVTLEPVAAESQQPAEPTMRRKALRTRISMEQYERIWPLAEMRFRLGEGDFEGKAITLVTTNPHYHPWHPADGGSVEGISDSGQHYKTRYLIVHFLLDDVKELSPV